MARFEYYGKKGLPKVDLEELKGKLIVIEGTDGVGRSTHIGLLKQWLENNGHAVLDTGMSRSALAGEGLKSAKEGHTLGWLTMTLFYATDFADRLENEMIPALRAGFIVLTDRYIFSQMARALLRGGDQEWIKRVFEFALKPDLVIYLRVGVQDLITRVIQHSGFNYWESGMDLHLGEDMYESFVEYQSRMLREFGRAGPRFRSHLHLFSRIPTKRSKRQKKAESVSLPSWPGSKQRPWPICVKSRWCSGRDRFRLLCSTSIARSLPSTTDVLMKAIHSRSGQSRQTAC
jgi:dTMP kinase